MATPRIEILTGAPGTGKTTAIATVSKSLLEDGLNIALVSLTNTAAQEIRRRGLNDVAYRFNRKVQTNTLHSLAYKALDKPTMATGKDIIDEWNALHPQLQLKPDRASADADGYLPRHNQLDPVNEYNLRRARGELLDDMPPLIQEAGRKWEQFKGEGSLLDFEDLLQEAAREIDRAPDDPDVLCIDEAQDHSASEIALAVKWGLAAELLLVVGDEDQCIYRWRGATPESLRIPGAKHYALPRSYRVPRQVYKYSRRILAQITDRRPTDFEPRDEEGEVILRPDFNLRDPRAVINQIKGDIALHKKVMILTTCGYMLSGVIKALRWAGLTYHNPFKPDEPAWNPIKFSDKTVNNLQRVAAWYAYHSEGNRSKKIKQEELSHWVPLLKLEALFNKPYPFKRDLLDKGAYDEEVVRALMKPEARERMMRGDLVWLYENTQAQYKKINPYTRDYHNRIITKYGATMARYHAQYPNIIVSTIHGVKGGEADSVYLFTDLSRQGQYQWLKNYEGRDDILRLFYVGATRARETLTICGRLKV